MATRTRKEREHEQREEEILEAALHLFAGERWESVTVDQIAAQAEVSKGTVYNHFSSKDEIYARLALRFFRGLLHRLEQLPKRGDPAEAMANAFRIALLHHIEHGEFRNVRQYVFRAGFWERIDPSLIHAFEELDTAFRDWTARLLNLGIEEGIFSQQPIEPLMTGLDALFNGAVTQLWGGQCWQKVEPEPYIDAVIGFAMNSLKK